MLVALAFRAMRKLTQFIATFQITDDDGIDRLRSNPGHSPEPIGLSNNADREEAVANNAWDLRSDTAAKNATWSRKGNTMRRKGCRAVGLLGQYFGD